MFYLYCFYFITVLLLTCLPLLSAKLCVLADSKIEILQRELQIAVLEIQKLKLNLLQQQRQHSLELYKVRYEYQHGNETQPEPDVYGEDVIG